MKGWGPALAAAAVAVAAAACSSSGSTHPLPSASTGGSTPVVVETSPSVAAPTSAAPTDPPPSSPPSSPAAASFPATEAGAYAIVKALYAAQDAAAHSRSAAAYDELTLAGCSCRSVDAFVAKLNVKDAHIRGENFQPANVSDYSRLDGDHAQVRAAVSVSAGKILSSTNAILEEDPATSIVEVVSLSVRQNGWVVSEVHRLGQS